MHFCTAVLITTIEPVHLRTTPGLVLVLYELTLEPVEVFALLAPFFSFSSSSIVSLSIRVIKVLQRLCNSYNVIQIKVAIS